jgi:hypothetical protein
MDLDTPLNNYLDSAWVWTISAAISSSFLVIFSPFFCEDSQRTIMGRSGVFSRKISEVKRIGVG